jgi:hypothetical protein
LIDEINATGAVLAGRRAVEQADHWQGNHHASRSPCSAIGRRLRPWRTIPW